MHIILIFAHAGITLSYLIPSVWCRKQRETQRNSGNQRRMPCNEIRWGKAITIQGVWSWAVCDDCVCCCSHCTNNKFKQWPPKEPHRWPCLFNFCHHCVFFAACCSVSDAIVPIGRQLFVSAFVFAVSFSSNYLANKQASNWTEDGNELCSSSAQPCPATPKASSSLPSLPATRRLARSTGPAYLQSPAASEALFHVHGSARFSIFCCLGVAALLSLRFRFTFYALRSLFAPVPVPGQDFVVAPNFSCASPFDLRWFLVCLCLCLCLCVCACLLECPLKVSVFLCFFHQFYFVSFHFIEFSHIRIRIRIRNPAILLVAQNVPLASTGTSLAGNKRVLLRSGSLVRL